VRVPAQVVPALQPAGEKGGPASTSRAGKPSTPSRTSPASGTALASINTWGATITSNVSSRQVTRDSPRTPHRRTVMRLRSCFRSLAALALLISSASAQFHEEIILDANEASAIWTLTPLDSDPGSITPECLESGPGGHRQPVGESAGPSTNCGSAVFSPCGPVFGANYPLRSLGKPHQPSYLECEGWRWSWSDTSTGERSRMTAGRRVRCHRARSPQ